MSIPDAAIEAAAEAMGPSRNCECTLDSDTCDPCTMTAVAGLMAAMPAIREAIAQEIEGDTRHDAEDEFVAGWNQGIEDAARIVRGGDPT